MKYVQGDLINALQVGHVNVIAHQANCFCKGRRGIAPLIFEAFPEAKQADDATEVGDKNKLGTFTFGKYNSSLIYNLYGQYTFDNKDPTYGTDYNALESALKAMKEDLDTKVDDFHPELIRIGFPLIGCGLAGGDWKVVSGFIENIFNDPEKYDIYIFTLDKIDGTEYVN